MMKKKNRTRHDARRTAMQAVHMLDQNPDVSSEHIREFVHFELKFPKLEVFTNELIDGVRTNRQQIDAAISQSTENWQINRMAVVDRAILRLAAYELLFCPQTPPGVAINEALELAKAFSADESVSFLNGVLDRIAKKGTTAEP